MMELSVLTSYFAQYGVIFLFIIVFLEYMNLPGLPAGIIMPLAGIWVSNGGVNFITALVLSVVAGVLGSWVLYFIGRLGGQVLINKFLKRFPKYEQPINKNFDILRNKGYVGVFISKLIPMARTLISIPAGMLKLDFFKYTLSSMFGIIIWNSVFIGAGYLCGDSVFRLLANI